MILVLQHAKEEGPGTLGSFFQKSGWEVSTIHLYKETRLPGDLSGVQAVMVMGGPMNVYEEDRFPFLKEEDIFLKRAISEEVPILGICLGAQLLAKAAGAKVKKAPHAEIGWAKVTLTKEGKNDQLFKGLPEELEVFQWHEDSFELPVSAIKLAEHPACPNQAFCYRKNCYGLQFHIEVDATLITDWVKSYQGNDDLDIKLKARDMLLDYYIHREKFDRRARKLYLNFSKLIRTCRIPA
ncbi:MAG: type 1 glutamine amidotransferase [Candidatus Omnitrophota bacterium]